jgi:acetyl-CoA/propionyl-CoA carboxylase carboxyl transferase subunit
MTAVIGQPQPDVDTPDFRHPSVRLAKLLDPGSVVPVVAHGESSVQVLKGRIKGNPVIAYCTDGSTMGGALGSAEALHIVDAIDRAVHARCPVVGVWHSGGAKLAQGVLSMDGVGQMFAAMTRASGIVPQISLVLGPAAGAAAYGPALTDLVVMSAPGRMFVTGPDVVRTVTGEQIDMEGLGGVDAHGRRSGVVHVTADSEADAFARTRRIVDLLARPGGFDLHSAAESTVDFLTVLPESPRRAYDVRPLIRALLDSDCDGAVFEELQPRWAPNVVIGLGRLAGRTVGVIANNPIRKGGCLDSLSAEKTARFVRMCDCFGVPLVVLVDVPGYLPGVAQEWEGIIRRGAKLLYAFAEAVVPRVTLVTRKSYGGAYIAMNSRSLGATTVLAWPAAQVAVMGAEAAVNILHRRKLAAAAEPEREAMRDRLVAEQTLVADVDRSVELGVIDDIIDPAQTRYRLAEALATAPGGRGRHGNIPL